MTVMLYFLFNVKQNLTPSTTIVDGGTRAVIFDKIYGIQEKVVGEGTHFRIPIIQEPIIMDIRSRPRIIHSSTGTKDLQMV